MAQWLEHLIHIQGVRGSNPLLPTILLASEKNDLPDKLTSNPYESYINSLTVAGKAEKTIIEAKFVIRKLKEAGINLYTTNIDELTAYLAKIPGKEIRDWKTGEKTGKFSYANRATHRKVIVKIFN